MTLTNKNTLRVLPPLLRRPVVSERPLTLAEQRARTRWRKPVAAIIADALASNRGLLERLKRGMYAPDMKGKEQYQVDLQRAVCDNAPTNRGA